MFYSQQESSRVLVIGGIAVYFHGYTRATGDADIWYLPKEKNFRNLIESIQTFGYDTGDLEWLENYDTKGFIRIPLERFSIELLSIIDGNIEFSAALQRGRRNCNRWCKYFSDGV